ncbi:D-arabinose 1-dehydrogenase, Zn-dependent alcohol dehydrogenase family [Saccharopolyspora kobensis]|uniref:D-arabinose 1-dehydrogenase, Zn-dependent alcohol dehydrogenase family n=1 Tax=Saccharopolyspora kobensis TaxID=146035 RepID=A0A1H6AQV0_9PSEU|nr:zinc-binding dehydrogenase [Saccharopolyspora kobensis]SEG51119.1 D-arabinose 1-dehydrogenase, Zn-dependent alcohol dehydrogenase family [Saccharopolyspora kobensis]SFE77085.1 D-arabinose 1-dehydrogenase, Zn-dependent alcohol dehydrogenase family [Saccharopolyspora kobensis]
MDTMLAGRLHVPSGKFRVEEVPVPVPGPGEVLIEVKAAGVCLSDVHLIDGSLKPFVPVEEITLGHEVAGVIHSLGPDLGGDWTPGTRVALQAGQSCGECANCRRRRAPCLMARTRGVDYDGGWAQYAIAREDTLAPIPDDLPFDQAAIIPDAVSTPYAAIVATGDVRPAQAVGIWGAGGLGAHGIQLARLAGAAPVIAVDPLASARERALAFGADLALDPADPDFAAAVLRATGGRGLDVAFDFAGVPAVREQAARTLCRGGAMVLAGLTPQPLTVTDGTRFSWNRNEIRGHYGSGPEHVEQLIRLAATGRLDLSPSISGHLPLAEAAEAVHRLENKVGDPIRLVLVP